MEWTSKPDDDERYCCRIEAGAYELWRRGGELWIFNIPTGKWLRLPDSTNQSLK